MNISYTWPPPGQPAAKKLVISAQPVKISVYLPTALLVCYPPTQFAQQAQAPAGRCQVVLYYGAPFRVTLFMLYHAMLYLCISLSLCVYIYIYTYT